jgi:GrpB-like predicted nucleotidyltransferase (UPF0157 family)
LAEYPPEVLQRFQGSPEQMVNGVVREPPRGWRTIAIEEYDPAWADRFDAVSAVLRDALGPLAIDVQHVGSTSVPGLAAKPIIDIDLMVADAEDESRYIPPLDRLGYWLVLREPWWHGHRMLVDVNEDVHLHVWPQGAPEPIRHRLSTTGCAPTRRTATCTRQQSGAWPANPPRPTTRSRRTTS